MRVWITGAARGLGLSLTRLFLEEEDTVWAAARDLHAPSLTQLSARYGGRLKAVCLDLSQPDQIPKAVAAAAESAPFDVLINNAGVLTGKNLGLDSLSIGEAQEALRVNLIGPMALTQALLPLMRGARRPAILNISSEAGSVGVRQSISYSYCISKAGMNMFTNLLRADPALEDFQLLAIHPGRMKTDMGGAHRTLLPEETARGIRGLLTGETRIAPGDWLIDYTGQKMDF